MSLGENIRRLRIEKGITQEELAEKVGYSHKSSINKIETGQAKVPQEKIEQIAAALYVTPDILFFGMPAEATINLELLDEESQRKLLSYYEFLLSTQGK